MTGTMFTRWGFSAVLAASLGVAAMLPAAPAKAGDDLIRVLVDVADVIYHGGYPYYRHGHGYGNGDRLIVIRDSHRRPTYYRYVPRTVYYRQPPPYGRAYGYYGKRPERNVHVRYVDRDYYYRDGRHRGRDRDWDDDDRDGHRGKKGRYRHDD